MSKIIARCYFASLLLVGPSAKALYNWDSYQTVVYQYQTTSGDLYANRC